MTISFRRKRVDLASVVDYDWIYFEQLKQPTEFSLETLEQMNYLCRLLLEEISKVLQWMNVDLRIHPSNHDTEFPLIEYDAIDDDDLDNVDESIYK